MKYKGIRKLNKTVSSVLKPYGIKNAFYDDEIGYCYFPGDGKVSFKIIEEDFSDELFIDFIRENFGYTVFNSFIISLLHEVGHHYTLDLIDDETNAFCEFEKERISVDLANATTKEEIKELNYQYFNLPDEIEATAWAVEYAEKHPQQIKRMWRKVCDALYTFCEKNDIFSEED